MLVPEYSHNICHEHCNDDHVQHMSSQSEGVWPCGLPIKIPPMLLSSHLRNCQLQIAVTVQQNLPQKESLPEMY